MKILKRKGGGVNSDYKEKSRGGKLSKACVGFFLHLVSQRSKLEKSKDHYLSYADKCMLPTYIYSTSLGFQPTV